MKASLFFIVILMCSLGGGLTPAAHSAFGGDSAKDLAGSITGSDGEQMILVPAGEFTMGSPNGVGSTDEHPEHRVYLDAYYLDQYEVTVEQYGKFLSVTNRKRPKYWEQVSFKRDARKPVVGVHWHDAQAYCQWAGKRLPTEAEWEKAARGTDKRIYPWGDGRPNFKMANFGQNWSSKVVYKEKLKEVGSYEQGKSPYGIHDMAGNVWEWVSDWYAKDSYSESLKKDPRGLKNNWKILRGGSWNLTPSLLRSSFRNNLNPKIRYADLGFRCAQDAP